MKRLQWILVALISFEATALLVGWYRADQDSSLPVTRLNVLDPEAARDIRQREQNHRPENRKDWLDLAAVYRTFGLLPEAIYCYEQAELRGPLRPEYHFDWGISLSRFGQMEAAQEHLEHVITSHHEWEADAWLQIGLNYLRQEDPQQAEQALRNATQRPMAKLALARLLMRTGRAEEAIQVLDDLLDRNPDGLRIHQLKSWAHELAGEKEKADYHRDRVLRATDSLTMHDQSRQQDDQWFKRVGSGRVFFESVQAEQHNEVQQAIELGLQELKVAWQEDHALRLVYLLLLNKEPGKALLHLEKFVARVGESAESLTFMGEVLNESGKTAEAIQVWHRATGYRSSRFLDTNMRAHEKLMMAYEKSGDMEKAARQKGFMRLEKARLMWNKNEVRKSLVEFNAAVEVIPEAHVARVYLAETRRLLGDGSGAREAYEKCLQLRPHHGRAQRALARLTR